MGDKLALPLLSLFTHSNFNATNTVFNNDTMISSLLVTCSSPFDILNSNDTMLIGNSKNHKTLGQLANVTNAIFSYKRVAKRACPQS